MTLISIIYLILAVLGLSFLIFIHELGHYFMARRTGMRVETFSIGFGKPIYTWKRDGVNWQIGWLPFGGFVKIEGMDTGDERNLYEVKDGFFGKRPIDRIKVAVMGPAVNIVFALIAFTILWFLGGREKNFSEYTHKIGWIDPKSQLFVDGVRPGDEISAYNNNTYQSAKDHVAAPMTSHGDIEVKGNHVNALTKEKTPFNYVVKPYSHPAAADHDVLTAGILHPASYIIYGDNGIEKNHSLPEGSPMQESGIIKGDRIVWVDGVSIYSLHELTYILNEAKALVTVQRDQDILLRRVPRVLVGELKLDPEVKEEISDWQFESHLKNAKLQKLYYIPYNISPDGVVENEIKFIDKEKGEETFPQHLFSSLDAPLKEGDRIIAIDGIPTTRSYQILANLQQHRVNIIVERSLENAKIPLWQQADGLFDQQYRWEDLQRLTAQIGISSSSSTAGNLVLLNAVVPKARKDFQMSAENKAQLQDEIEEQAHEIEKIENPEKKALALQLLKERENQLFLGLPAIQDQRVQYNPNPIALFDQVFEEIWHTLKALVTGSLNPKWMSGPIGIVQVVHDRSMISLKEAIYWLGAISLNLGFLNLLPLPVLDGGTICFALYELITGRRLKAKTLEKLIIPFAILLIGFFIFLTYHDLSRIFSGWMH